MKSIATEKTVPRSNNPEAVNWIWEGLGSIIGSDFDKFSANEVFEMFRFVTPETADKVIEYCKKNRMVPEFTWWKRIKCWSWDAVTDSSGRRVTR